MVIHWLTPFVALGPDLHHIFRAAGEAGDLYFSTARVPAVMS